MTRVSDLRVGALEYAVTASDLVGIRTRSSGARERFRVGPSFELVPKIDALRSELRDPMSISAGRTPQLREFAADWGR